MNSVFIPTLAKFSAIFLQTPPSEIFIDPGIESFALNSLLLKPIISTIDAPSTSIWIIFVHIISPAINFPFKTYIHYSQKSEKNKEKNKKMSYLFYFSLISLLII